MATPSAILHVYAETPETLVAAVARYASVDVDAAARWLAFGAVYCDGARAREDRRLRGGEYLRIHRNPRRFPVAGTVDWAKTLVATHDDFYVVDKPPGVPIHATLDNLDENVVAQLDRLTGERLFVTQRLDLPTCGLCIVARTKAFQSAFNRLLSESAVKKRYRAEAHGSPPLGRHVAFQEPSDRAPRTMAVDAKPQWKRCSLVVEAVEPLDAATSRVTILLETGRTHQIRAQLSLLGHPLVGDTLYGAERPTARAPKDDDGEEEEPPLTLQLQSAELSFGRNGIAHAWSLAIPSDWSRK